MEALQVFRALADESRLRLVNVLGSGRYNVQELTSILQLSQPTISHHLKVLQSAEIVHAEREGTWAYFTLNSDQPQALPFLLTKNFLERGKNGNKSAFNERLEMDRQTATSVLDSRREEARRFFDTVAKDWKHLRHEAQTQQSYMHELLAQIKPDCDLLELGCGSGALLEQILPRPGKTIGIDYSEAMLDEARQTLGAKALGVDLRLGYLEHLPVADNSIDCVVAYMVLHHVSNPIEVLRDSFRILKSGGRIAVIDLKNHKNEDMRLRYADLWLGFKPVQFEAWGKTAGFCDIEIKLLGKGKKEAFLFLATKRR